MVQLNIKDIPDDVVDTFKRRAAAEGKSLQSYLRQHLIDAAAQRSKAEYLAIVERTLATHDTPGSTLETTLADIRAGRGEDEQ